MGISHDYRRNERRTLALLVRKWVADGKTVRDFSLQMHVSRTLIYKALNEAPTPIDELLA